MLLQKGFFVRCDRVHKAARPGRTKRVKYPKFLEYVPRQDQTFTGDGEGFYSWQGHVRHHCWDERDKKSWRALLTRDAR
jgi:hypothetical protein